MEKISCSTKTTVHWSSKKERQLYSLERRLDLINRESRAALGEVRSIMNYHKKRKQKVIIGYLDRPEWKQHQTDYREKNLCDGVDGYDK